jgi:hypothetical protein
MPTYSELVAPDTVQKRLFETLTQAQRQIRAFGQKGWVELALSYGEGLRTLYARAKQRGVSMRALIAKDAATEQMRLFTDHWDIRAADWVPGFVLIIDETEMFQAFPSSRAPGGVRILHSNDPYQIEHYLEVFEHQWTRSRPVDEPAPADGHAIKQT